jgi:hypothetical protein
VRIVTDLTASGTSVLVIGGAAVAHALPSTTAALPAAPLPLLPRSGSLPDTETDTAPSTGTNA